MTGGIELLALGLSYPDGCPLARPVTEEALGRAAAIGSAGEAADHAALLREATAISKGFGPDLEPTAPSDPTDPRSAGWTFVVADLDPDKHAWVSAVRRLAEHRGMATPDEPLVFPGGDWHAQAEWVDRVYLGTPVGSRPKYVLLVGDPVVLPFSLQALIAVGGASVGRIDDTDDAVLAYVEKVLRLETSPRAVTRPDAVVFATDYGPRDPTHYSLRYMATPLADLIDARSPFATTRLLGVEATKEALIGALTQRRGTDLRPALVYSATHGMFAGRDRGMAEQFRVNGAICCAREPGPVDDWLLTAADVPSDATGFCEGGLFIEFACWGYGTPAESSFDHWRLGTSSINAERPFVSSLGKRLIAHPRGPIGFIGHVDTAWLHGFADPDHPVPGLQERYHTRLEPYLTAVQYALLRQWPSGQALDDLQSRGAMLSAGLADELDGLQKRGTSLDQLSAAEMGNVVDAFIRRNDSANFFLLGDPGARVRVGAR